MNDEREATSAARVDFYLADRNKPSQVVVKLVAKAWPGHRRVAICGPEAVLSELDRTLWEQPDGRFLPHGASESAPIRLLENPPGECDLLISLHASGDLPGGRYERVLEVVGPEENARAAARTRFRAWQAAGAEVHHHRI